MIYLLYYDTDHGGREEWNTFYTPVEAFATHEDRERRIQHLSKLTLPGDKVEFEKVDVEVTPAGAAVDFDGDGYYDPIRMAEELGERDEDELDEPRLIEPTDPLNLIESIRQAYEEGRKSRDD